jgi:GT2 family glycosyltransferase
MRVLVIVHGFPPRATGGAELYAHSHAHALRRYYGDEVLVFTRDEDASRSEYDVRTESRDGLRVVSVNNTFRQTRSFEETYRNDAITKIASRIIDEFKPDVAHIHHLTCLSTTIVRALAERGIPRIVTLHDYWFLCHRGQLFDTSFRACDGPEPSRCHACVGAAGGATGAGFLGAIAVREIARRLPAEPARRLHQAATRLAGVTVRQSNAERQASSRLAHMREVCREVTHFLAPSRCLRDRFVEFGIEPERITHAPYGSDPDLVRGIQRTASDRLRLGFLGSLMASKAPDVLIEAMNRLPPGKATADFFGAHTAYHGDDSYRQKLEPLLTRNGVRARGGIPHNQVGEALASIDVLVVPSIWPENSPLVIQEAFLAGVPVVASRIGGIPEAIDENRNGLLFKAGDPQDLARSLARLIDEPGLLATLRRGIPRVRTIEEDVALARTLYAKTLQAPPRRRLAAVVLNYRTPDDTLLAVRSILASRRPADDVIVVDNDTVENAREALDSVRQRIQYLHTAANLGFPGGVNAGIREALAQGADRVLLVNSDMIVPPDCLARLDACLDAAPGAGIAGPLVLARADPREIASFGISYGAFGGRVRNRRVGDRVATLDRSFNSTVDAVSGCLMLVDRRVFDAIGLFDEDYFFSFEDLDFCLRARRAGFATVLAGLATAYHEGGRSIGAASPRRLYFAARGHLLLAHRTDPSATRLVHLRRTASIVMLNVAHAVRTSGGSLPARLGAVARGTRDYFAGRFGPDA